MARRVFAATLVVVVGASLARADDVTVLDACRYASDAEARAAWRPIEGSPAARRADDAALLLACPFSTFDNWRAAWDRSGTWDLAGAQRIELDVDASRYVQLILYLQADGGWYRCGAGAPAGVSTVVLARKKFGAEGTPRGWDGIRALRLCVQRHGAQDCTLRVRAIRAVAVRADVAVYRNDAGIADEGGVPNFVKGMADALERLSVAHEILDDRAVEAGRLADKRVVIMPLNPVLPPRAATALERFVSRGGKLIVFYRLPDPLGRLLGVRHAGTLQGRGGALASIVAADGRWRFKQNSWIARRVSLSPGTDAVAHWADAKGVRSDNPAVTRNQHGVFVGHVLTGDDAEAKGRWLMRLTGDLCPAVWRRTYEGRKRDLGRIAGFGGVDELCAWITRQHRTPADALVRGARRTIAEAERAAARGGYEKAVDALGEARASLLRAYASALPSRRGEVRGIWCHRATGLGDRSWDDVARQLSERGINAVFPNMLWGGSAAYESSLLPVVPEVKERGDQISACLMAARRHGLAIHVWKVNWRLWGNTPEEFRARLRAEGRLQVDPRGREIGTLCPSHEANFALERDSMLEVARNYPVDGLHFDYIRYPSAEGCYCATCRRRFEREEGVTVGDWPRDVTEGRLREKYLAFRRRNISRLVEAVSLGAREIRPGIEISAAVFWNWEADRDRIGQDWRLWIERGWLDFVCPMTYTTEAGAFEHSVGLTRTWAGQGTVLLPGIGASLGQRPDDTLRQVLIARERGAQGFVVFDLNQHIVDDVLPLFKLGVTRE